MTPDTEHPAVFISYSHDSPAHEKRVLKLAERLRADGVDARIDQYTPWPAIGWPRWMEKSIREARFVLLVCTETYHRRVIGQESPPVGRGVCWEANLIFNELYKEKVETDKYLPVLFANGTEEHIPPPLQGHSRFWVDTDVGYEELYRCLTYQPAIVPAALGKLKKLPALEALGERAGSFEAREATWQFSQISRNEFFISCVAGSPDEENLARFLDRHLSQTGHGVFVDMGTNVGPDWANVITERIQSCDQLIVLLSEHAMSSEVIPYVARTGRHAQRHKGRPKIVPVRVRYSGPLEYELDVYLQGLDAAEWNGPCDSEKLLNALFKASQAHQTSPHATVPSVVAGVGEGHAERHGDPNRPRAKLDPRSATVPGRVIGRDDPFYIERAEDRVVGQLAPEIGQTLVIKGPHQMGKSSLLLSYLSGCQQMGKRVVFVDFSLFSDEDFRDYSAFLSTLALIIQHRMGMESSAKPGVDSPYKLFRFMEKEILAPVGVPVTLAFDDVDRLLGHDHQVKFFTMLRAWHERRTPLHPEWESLDLALVISTEPYLLIPENCRSPFNVGCTLNVGPFRWEDYLELNNRHNDVLSGMELNELWELLRGHPYLTRLAMYRLAGSDKIAPEALIERADHDYGPFGDHLRALLIRLHENPDLLRGLKQVILEGRVPQTDLFYRLHGAGLVRGEQQRIYPANLLYARFFKRAV